MNDATSHASHRDRLTATWVELGIRLGVLAFFLYWAFILVRPFITIAIWSVVLTVALDPVYERIVVRLGGRRRLAAVLFTLLSLLIVIGPATWLILGLIDALYTLSGRFDLTAPLLPPPASTVKSWPLVGDAIYDFWQLASTNLQAALGKVAPQLKVLGSTLLQIGTGAGTGALKFLIAIIIAGFLYPQARVLADAAEMFACRVASDRGAEFIQLAGATIRVVARGVIGISALQALLAGLGVLAAGIPAASLITSAVLILGIIQVGPAIVLLPLIVWSWFSMETTSALLFTAYMIPVGLLDNILRPLLMGRGLRTPMLVILIGVVGGTLSQGITGLFLGPIILAVIWELLVAWVKDNEKVATSSGD
jgi:predicted PurR-regulated permease PerM